MEKLDLEDFDQKLPDHLNLAVVMEKQPSTHPWADFRYDALGVVVREQEEAQSVTRIYHDGEVEHFLITGLSLQLHVDECESYYHNLMSPEPGCFIVASQPDSSDEMPVCANCYLSNKSKFIMTLHRDRNSGRDHARFTSLRRRQPA